MAEEQSERERLRAEQEAEREAERELNARMHRYFGVAATVMVVIALVVAMARMKAMFGVSPLQALGLGATGLPWVLLILGAGVAFSFGPILVGRMIDSIRAKKAGR